MQEHLSAAGALVGSLQLTLIKNPTPCEALWALVLTAGWCNGYSVGLAIDRSRVRILLEATLRNNLRQVDHTCVPLSPSSSL